VSVTRARLYPWFMSLMGLAVLFVSNGLTATALSVYDESLLDAFGWTRGELKFRDFLNFATVAVIAPFAGVLIDRIGVKRMLIAGLALLSLGYFGYSGLSSLTNMYLIHVVFALSLSSAGTMVIVILLSSWFLSGRGLAIGIALVGTSLGSIVLSPLNAWLIATFGWRRSFYYEAFMPLGLIVLVVAFVKSSPRDIGSVAVGQDIAGSDLRAHGLTLSQAMRTRTFWCIGLSGMMTYYSILALYNHLYLHLRDLGYAPLQASFALSLLGLVALVAKLVNGALADRIDRHRVFLGCIAIMLLGVAGLATLRADLVIPSIAVVGLGWGGLFTLYNMLTVNNFGLRAAGRIGGVVSFMEALGGGLGIWLTGVLYDRHGNYGAAFTTIVVLVALGLVAGTQIRSEVDRPATVSATTGA
jgi:MFS family permease